MSVRLGSYPKPCTFKVQILFSAIVKYIFMSVIKGFDVLNLNKQLETYLMSVAKAGDRETEIERKKNESCNISSKICNTYTHTHTHTQKNKTKKTPKNQGSCAIQLYILEFQF